MALQQEMPCEFMSHESQCCAEIGIEATPKLFTLGLHMHSTYTSQEPFQVNSA